MVKGLNNESLRRKINWKRLAIIGGAAAVIGGVYGVTSYHQMTQDRNEMRSQLMNTINNYQQYIETSSQIRKNLEDKLALRDKQLVLSNIELKNLRGELKFPDDDIPPWETTRVPENINRMITAKVNRKNTIDL